jgi:hypothetical protein
VRGPLELPIRLTFKAHEVGQILSRERQFIQVAACCLDFLWRDIAAVHGGELPGCPASLAVLSLRPQIKQVVPALGCSEEQGMTTRIRQRRAEHPILGIRIAVGEFVHHEEVQTDLAQ